MDFIHAIVIKALPDNSKNESFSNESTSHIFSLVVKPISMNVLHLPVRIMVLVLIKSMVTHVIALLDISIHIV